MPEVLFCQHQFSDIVASEYFHKIISPVHSVLEITFLASQTLHMQREITPIYSIKKTSKPKAPLIKPGFRAY